MARKRKLSVGLSGGVKFPGKQGSSPRPGMKGNSRVAVTSMPGNQTGGSQTIARPRAQRSKRATNFGLPVTRADSGINWTGQTKTNTQTGNARAGSTFEVGYDKETGQVYHRYPQEAGGIPAEVIGVKQTPEQKAAFKKRRALKSKMR
jgi:hypothetical protein